MGSNWFKFIILFKIILETESSSFINNGKQAQHGQFPYQIYISSHYQDSDYQLLYNCGGALLNKKYGITAAHCVSPEVVEKEEPIFVEVYIGVHKLSAKHTDGEARNVTKIIRHEKFEHETGMNDIALVQFERPVRFSKYIQPVILPKIHQDVAVGEIVTLSGWGDTETQQFPDVLSYVNLKVLALSQCKTLLEKYATQELQVTENNVCVLGMHEPAGSCHGDSGGPLVMKERSVLVGITSFKGDSSCKESKGPDVFTRVHSYLNWIKKAMQVKNASTKNMGR